MNVRALLVLLAGLSLAGCGLFDGKDDATKPMGLVDFDATVPVARAWTSSVGSGLGKSAPGLAPWLHEGLIWAAGRKGRVAAIDLASGRTVRRFDFDLPVSAGPSVFGRTLLLGLMNGQVLVADAETGEIRWRAQLSSEILAHPVLADGRVVVRCIDGRVFALDAETGLRQWVYDRSVPLLTLRGNSAPLVRAGQVLVGHDDGAVSALSLASGELLWEQRVGTPEGRSELDRLADIDGPMAIVGLDLYAASRRGRATSITLDSGRLLWVKELGSASGLAVERTRLALTDPGDTVWMLDRRSGSTQWSNEQLLRRGLTRPVMQGNFVAVADSEGYIHWLDADSGSFVARVRGSRNSPATAPLVAGNLLVLMDVEGRLSAWRVGAGS
ncbi:MAG: outer membrane protein assembly factor BamB [Wenzhouxiangellaceae bacterium]|nr:outer membrane protein assembly factor BamB [Wenzhouxiangellaceae bacterium]